MGFDRGQAEVEQRRDLLVRSTFREQLELFLAICQQVIRVGQSALLQLPDVVLDQHAGNGRAEERLARAHRPDRRQEILVGGTFQEVGPRAGSGCGA